MTTVRPAENRAELQGVVRWVQLGGDGMQVVLDVGRVRPVPGMANLLAGAAGQTLPVTLVPGGGDDPPQTGARIRLLARLAAPRRTVSIPGTLVPAL